MWPAAIRRSHVIKRARGPDTMLKKHIGEHEPAYADQWRTLSPDYQRTLADWMPRLKAKKASGGGSAV